MGTITILPQTERSPITLIGRMAGVCWCADTSDDAKNYRRGLDCIESNHGRTLEFPDVYMILDGYSARVMREWYTHIGGMPTRLQASTRYIDYANFDCIAARSIHENRKAMEIYGNTVRSIRYALQELEKLGIPREDAAMLLPLGMCTKVVDKRNLRSLIDMSHQRMCQRAYWEFRELFKDICQALAMYSDEWWTVVTGYFKPKCAAMGYCPEKHGCGRWPVEGKP